MDVIGMTNLQEAKLARGAGICYSTLALVTDTLLAPGPRLGAVDRLSRTCSRAATFRRRSPKRWAASPAADLRVRNSPCDRAHHAA